MRLQASFILNLTTGTKMKEEFLYGLLFFIPTFRISLPINKKLRRSHSPNSIGILYPKFSLIKIKSFFIFNIWVWSNYREKYTGIKRKMIYYYRQSSKKKMEDGMRSLSEFFIILTSKFLNLQNTAEKDGSITSITRRREDNGLPLRI